jgi:hypothetical protein
MPDKKHKYAFALQRNARAFIETAVEYARQGYRENWKFAVLHLNTALELVLKATLALEDHRYLVAGKAQITDRQFDEGAFRSIGIEECLERLAKTGLLTLDGSQRQTVEAMQRLRNRIAHYIDPDDTATMRAIVAAGVNLFIDIHNAAFAGDEDPYGARPIRDLVVDLHKFDDFVKERLSTLALRLRASTRPRTHHLDECSWCLQDAAIIDGDEVTCLFCGHGMAVREFAELKSDDDAAQECPDCGRPSVLKDHRLDREPTHECFVCGYFRGAELKWSDGKGEIPRLHADR